MHDVAIAIALRTVCSGYRDTLLGGDPEDMVWEQASRFANNGRGGGGGRDADREAEAFAHLGREDLAGVDGGEPHRRSHRNGDESVSNAMRAWSPDSA